MQIVARKLTDVELMRRACEMTMRGQESKMTLGGMYRCEHSPMRTQLFWVEMIGVPTFVSVHFVRHKIGVEHFVMSNRDGRGGDEEVNRWTPVNHGMLLNAQALINMARKRLCRKSHESTRKVMGDIKIAIAKLDWDLARYMVPECIYRLGCHESNPCGYVDVNFEVYLSQKSGHRKEVQISKHLVHSY